MKYISHLLLLMIACCSIEATYGQGAKNIKINEVLTGNDNSLQDDYGQHLPWVELVNVSYSTYNVRNMFVTTDRTVLDKSLTAPARIAKMSVIPSGDKVTTLNAREHLILFLNSHPSRGTLHLSAPVNDDEPLWIALYDGNGVDLIDSVSVPVMQSDMSFARMEDGAAEWGMKDADQVTPGTENLLHSTETKASRLKRDDPHGFGITVLSMAIVFSCLALLYVFFTLFGLYMKRQQAKQEAQQKRQRKEAFLRHKDKMLAEAKAESEGMDTYMAVIAMALKQYQDHQHDEESGIITIKPKFTSWVHIAQETGEPRQ